MGSLKFKDKGVSMLDIYDKFCMVSTCIYIGEGQCAIKYYFAISMVIEIELNFFLHI